MLKKIKKLDVEAEAIIEIVELDGQELVLKTSDPYEVLIEKNFVDILRQNNIGHLELFEDKDLLPSQLLMEYIKDSPTVDKNENPEWLNKWGASTKKIHDVKSTHSTKIQEDGSFCEIDWGNFLKERYQKAVSKNDSNKLLDLDTVIKIGKFVDRLADLEIGDYSLIHGDLHDNNVLIKSEDVVLFDKGNPVIFGDRFYDLAIFMINFGFSESESDKRLFDSFIKGYGENFLEINKERVELNTLLRAFERNGNKHEPQTSLIISKLLEKL